MQPITRRALLASLAAVAGAAAARSAPAFTTREAFYMAEHKWATQGLLDAARYGDFSAWMFGGSEAEKPSRWRLARAVLGLREVDDPTPLEQTLRAEFEEVWRKLTRPWHTLH
jgi:hypothetical protein